MRVAILLSMAALALLVAVPLVTDQAGGKVTVQGDLVVDAGNQDYYSNAFRMQEVVVQGNVTVMAGATLRLSEVSMSVEGTSDASHAFDLRPGATLIAGDSTIEGDPYTIRMVVSGNATMFDCTLRSIWAGNDTHGMAVDGGLWLSHCVLSGAPNGTGAKVTGVLNASQSVFSGFGDTVIAYHDPAAAARCALVGCEFTAGASAGPEGAAVLLNWTEAVEQPSSLAVEYCELEGFAYGLDLRVNTTAAHLTLDWNDLSGCGTGIRLYGNRGTLSISNCTILGSGGEDGVLIHVPHAELSPLNVTTRMVSVDGFENGIHVIGPVGVFKPLLDNVTISSCGVGVSVLGSTVRVQGSSVTDCDPCFYVSNKARIEVRRTEHTWMSVGIAPNQLLPGAVVSYATVSVSSVSWKGAHAIGEGDLHLVGEDGLEAGRMEIADLEPQEVIAWTVSKYTRIGKPVLIPQMEQRGVRFSAANFSVYNETPQAVQLVDHLPPVVSGVWPPDGHWFGYTRMNVSGRVMENGTGLAELVLRIEGGQSVKVPVGPDGNWSVEFDEVPDGTYTIEATATDLAAGVGSAVVSGVHVDTLPPRIDLDDDEPLLNVTWVNVTGTTEPRALVHVWELGADPNSSYLCDSNGTADGEGRFDVYLCLGEGWHDLSVTSTDLAGNINQTTFRVMMDPTPPYIVIDSPRPAAWLSNGTVTVAFTVMRFQAGPPPHDAVRIEVNGEEVPLEGPFSIDLELDDGRNVVRVDAWDGVGNHQREEVEVFVDTRAPRISLVAPDRLRFFTLDDRVDLEGELVEDNLELLTLNRYPLDLVGSIFLSTLQVREGENVFSIVALDMAGNEDQVTITILKDRTAPSLTWSVTPLNGSLLEADGVTLATADGDDPVLLRFDVDPNEWVRLTAVGGLGVAEGEEGLVIVLQLEEGANDFVLSVEDEAGNEAEPITYSVELDTTPPSIQLQDVVDGMVTGDENIRLRGRLEPGSTLEVNGRAVAVNADGTFSHQVELEEGENVFELGATDRVGLVGNRTLTVVRRSEADDSPGPGAALVTLCIAAGATTAMARRRQLWP